MKITTDRLARQLASALGAAAVSAEPSALAAHAVDGKVATLICAPSTPEQAAAALRICSELQAAVIPWGGGTAMAIGNSPSRADVILKTHQLDRIIDHDHANLTVTVQSGIALTTLQAALAPQKQFAPFDAPLPERSSLGGIVAANLNGPRRSSWGSVRDLVIGMKVVLGTGEQIKAGGKVVKNVAGYDMCKLFTGSLGSLGIITELTVRVAPIPQRSATGVAWGSFEQAEKLAGEITHSKLLPAAVILHNNAVEQNWRLAVSFEGFTKTVARQLRELDAVAQRLGMGSQTLGADIQQQLWQELRDLPLEAGRLVYRMTVPRNSLAQLIRASQSSPSGAPAIVADMAMGTVWLVGAANQAFADDFSRWISLAQRQRGHAVLFTAPAQLKQGFEIWGPAPPALALMRDIKRKFDPQGIVNPGRFVGGF